MILKFFPKSLEAEGTLDKTSEIIYATMPRTGSLSQATRPSIPCLRGGMMVGVVVVTEIIVV